MWYYLQILLIELNCFNINKLDITKIVKVSKESINHNPFHFMRPTINTKHVYLKHSLIKKYSLHPFQFLLSRIWPIIPDLR